MRDAGFAVAGNVERGVQLGMLEPREQVGGRHWPRLGANVSTSAATTAVCPDSKSTRQRAARRMPAGVDAAAGRKAARRRDRRPKAGRSATPLPSTVTRALTSRAVNAGDGGAADVGGDRHVVRPLDLGAGDERVAEAERGVDVEFGRVERGIELCRLLAGREDVSEAAGDGLAVESGLQALDRDLVAAEGNVAAQASSGRSSPCAGSGSAFEPGGQQLADRRPRSRPGR